MLQTPHGERDAVALTTNTMRESYADSPMMPVIDGEASYERLMDRIGTEWTRRMFWVCMTNGACGHTYGANGIWQVNRKGQPHGPSPHHAPGSTGYGVISWDEAMNLPGSGREGFRKKLFGSTRVRQPHREWAVFTEGDAERDDAEWILEGGLQEQRRRSGISAGTLRFPRQDDQNRRPIASADDQFTIKLNARTSGNPTWTDTWRTGKQFDDVAKLLDPERTC
jgi:hypothetical protein